MRVIAFFVVDGFYVQILGASHAQARPTAVHRDGLVIDANTSAVGRGLSVHMPLAEAKAILGGEGDLIAWDEERFRGDQKAWLDICADHSDAIEPITQSEALLDLSAHPKPEHVAARIQDSLRGGGFRASCGLATCRWVSMHAVGVGGMAGVFAPREFVAPLPVQAMPIPAEQQTRLRLLGYRTVGDVAALPIEVLRGQFGESAFVIRKAALGSGDGNVESAYPPDSVSARFTFDGTPDTMETYHNGVLSLSKDLGKRLAKDSYGESVDVWLEHEDGEITKVCRRFSKPLSSPGSCWASLRLLLAEPPKKPVVGLRVRVLDLRKVRRVQLALAGTASRSDRDQSSLAAVEHVRTAMGDGAIKLGSDLVEPRFRQVRKAWRSANGWSWT